MYDFLVIGGGIAGTSVGARLSRLGQVCLAEKENALAYHASGRSAAMFEQSYGLPSTIALNIASRDYHFSANGGYTSPRGLMLAGTHENAAQFETDCRSMQMEEISADEARAMIPILNSRVIRAGYHAEAWDLDTDRMVQDFARQISEEKGDVRIGAGVVSISRTDAGWVTTLADGQHVEARRLVNAAGAWADELAKLAGIPPLGLIPLRRSMARIPAPGGHNVSAWPMLFGPGETWYAKPDAGALIVSPADEEPSPPMDAWADDMILAEGLARYEAHVTEPVTRMLSNWAGLRTFSPDRNLVLGPDPNDERFIWMAGQGGYGFQTAPAASQLVADMVSGSPPMIEARMVEKLSARRFETG